MTVPQLRWLYDHFCRRLDKRVTYFIRYLARQGIKVYIITGNTQAYQKTLEKWLKKNGAIYDELYCYHSGCGLTIAQWKAKMAERLKIDYFIEDMPQIVNYLCSRQIKAILYNGKNIEELWWLIK